MKQQASESGEWVKVELSEVALGDKRLDWRVPHSATKLAMRPTMSINQACDDWADTRATYRLFWATFLMRTQPDAPATTILAPHELQALYHFHHRRPLPPEVAPTVAQATRWIAQLGGFLNRKGDGFPGVTVMWRGWQRLADIADAFLAFLPPPTYG